MISSPMPKIAELSKDVFDWMRSVYDSFQGVFTFNYPVVMKDTLKVDGVVGVGTQTPTLGKLVVQQTTNSASGGLTIKDNTDAQSVRVWADATRAHIDSAGVVALALNSVNGGRVGIGTQIPDTELDVVGTATVDGLINSGYSQLGSLCPSIKMKVVTGTLPASGGSVTVAHGLTAAKILALSGVTEIISGNHYPLFNQWTASIQTDNLYVTNNNAALENKTFSITITYQS